MFSAEPIAFAHGDFLPASQLALAVHDAGFVWGATVADLCRTFRQRLYRVPDHLARFRRSCQSAHIKLLLDDATITNAAARLVEHNSGLLSGDQELILVMIATPGLIGYYTGQQTGIGASGPTFAMHTFPLPYTRYRHLFEQGARLVTPRTCAVPRACVDPHIKQRSRMHWWIAEQEAHASDPSASALLLDENGLITETAFANVLLVRGDTVVSPPTETVLGGVSLQVVRELCSELRIPFVEQSMRLEDCFQADECLLTSTAFCVAGVRSLNGHTWPWPGPMLERLLSRWSDQVGVDIRGQIVTPYC